MSLLSVIIVAVVFLIILAGLFARRFQFRCPYRDPLCRTGKPCIQCYRDLYKTIAAKGGTS